jgi:hypothetical protein
VFIFGVVLAAMHVAVIHYYNRAALITLLFVYGIIFIVSTPYFSPVDEGAHFDYVRHIISNHKLPTLYDNIDSAGLSEISGQAVPVLTQYEAVHPPLYYLISALLTFPLFKLPVLHFFTLKIIGFLMLMASLILVIKSVLLLEKNNIVSCSKYLFFAIAVVLFMNPGILTRMVTISNENLAVLLTCLLFYYLLKFDLSKVVSYKNVVILSIITAGIIMTKLTVVFVAAAVIVYLFAKKLHRELTTYLLALIALISPWVFYNFATYGKPTATDLHVDFVKPIVNPQNIDFGIAFVFSRLSSMLGHFFVPQEFGYPYLPIEILTIIHVLSVCLLILFAGSMIYVFVKSKQVLFGNSLRNNTAEELQLFTYVWALCCLLSPITLAFGTIVEDVDIMIGRYMYVIVLPMCLLLLLNVHKIFKENVLKYVGAVLIILTSFLLADGIHTNAQSNSSLIGKYTKLTLENVDIQDLDKAMNQKIFEVSNLGKLPRRFGKFDLSNQIDVVLLPEYYNNVNGENGETFEIVGEDPHVVWKVSPAISGRKLAAFEISINGKAESELIGQIFWAESTEEFSEEESYKFSITEEGMYVLPLGKFRQWVQGEELHFIRFDIDGLEVGDKFGVVLKLFESPN